MKINLLTHELHPRRPFRIARPRREAVENVFLQLESEGVIGWGEASPNAFYGETAEGVSTVLQAAGPWIAGVRVHSVADIEKTWRESWPRLAPSRAAQCALDLALWDLLARREEVSVAELAWKARPKPVRTFATLGLSTPQELEPKITELHNFPMIKIKADAQADLHPVRRMRSVSQALIAVDANCAWGDQDLRALAAELAGLGVEFIEQPFPPAENARLDPGESSLPILADESCVVCEEVGRIAKNFDGFNIKLVKCGGITPGLAMARQGRELGLKTMVGCMLESSVLIAAGAVIAQQTDYSDLDGAWLLGNDPFRGWVFEKGILTPPATPGLGVIPAVDEQG